MANSKEIRILYLTTLDVSTREDADVDEISTKISKAYGFEETKLNSCFVASLSCSSIINQGKTIFIRALEFKPDLIVARRNSGIKIGLAMGAYLESIEFKTDEEDTFDTLICYEDGLENGIKEVAKKKGIIMNYDEEILAKETTEDIKEPVDMVNHPKHYESSCSLECIQVMKLMFGEDPVVWFCLCNAFKYMWRYKNKNGQEDLKKARWYLKGAEDIGSDDCTQKDIYTRLSDLLDVLGDNLA